MAGNAVRRAAMACLRKLAKCGTCFAKMFTKVEYTALLMCGVGMLLVMISVMIRWRLDEHGVTPLQNVWSIATFEQKSYGLLSVRAREYRSWTIITQEMCDWTGMKGGQIASFAQAIINGGGCDGEEACGEGLAEHLYMRCKEYSKIYVVNFAVLFVTFFGCLLSLIGMLVGCFRPLRRAGGITYGLLLFCGFAMLVLNVTWALVTWNAFTNLGESAWYPYPDLAIGWFLHLYGSLTMLISARVFGWLVMPLVRAFDPEEEDLQQRKDKLRMMNFWNRDREQQQCMMQQQQLPVQVQGMHPGQYGAYGNNAYEYPMAQEGGANIYGAPMGPGLVPMEAPRV